MITLRFPVYVDVFMTNEHGNNIESFHVGSVNLDLRNPVVSFVTYKRLRLIVNQLVKSETDVVSAAHMYVLDSDYLFLESDIKEVQVVDSEENLLITKIPIHPLTKASLEYILENFSSGGGVLIELLSPT